MPTQRHAVAPALFTIAALAALAAHAPPARAQRVTSSVDAAAASVSYDDGRGDGLLAFTPALDASAGAASLSLFGTLAARDAGMGSTASRGGGRMSLAAPALGPLRLEGSVLSGWDAFRPGVTTGYWRGEATARAGTERGKRGAWLSLGSGQAMDGAAWHAVATAGAGVWTRIFGATLEASLTNARGGATNRMVLSSRQVAVYDTVFGADTIIGYRTQTDTSWVRSLASNTDAHATLRWARGALGLELSAGRRLSAGAEYWGDARAMYWLSPRIALVAAGGSLPSSIADGRQASRYMTFGLHYAGRRPHAGGSREPPTASPTPSPAPTRASRPALEVGDAARAGGTREIRVRVGEAARTVELMADFTDWSAVSMHQDGAGEWVAALPIAPGTHRVNLRVNGGPWRIPPGLAPVSDDFDGAAGLLVVK